MANPGTGIEAHLRRRKSKANKKSGGGGGSSFFDQILKTPPGFGTASQPQSIAELLERQVANQKAQIAKKSAPAITNPIDSLQSQLYDAVNSIQVAPTPLETLRQLATQQVAAQYDPQISALRGEMDVHGKRAKRSASQAKGMYGALAQDYLSQLPELTAQFKAEDEATNARYDQAQKQMNNEYSKQAADQDAVLKRLGIQAASQDASQQSREDQSYFQNQSELDQQSAMDALNQQQMAEQSYTRDLGSNAKMAGANTVQDIRSELQDYLSQAGNQLAGLQGQKGSAIAALLAQMQQQDQQRVSQQTQQEFDNQMKLFNFQLAADKAANSGRQSSAGGFGSGDGTAGLTTGLAGAQNYLASQYPDQPKLASGLMGQLNDVLSNQNVVNGKFVLDPGDPSMGKSPRYSDVGQEYMMDLLRREFEKEGQRYTTGDINSTMNALLAYLGKLR